jgi:uncharacterized protein (DUF3084 family)
MSDLELTERLRLLVPIVTDEQRASAHDAMQKAADALEALQAERDAWRRVAQSATPGGSEFCTPAEVAEYTQDIKRRLIEAKKDAARIRKESQAERDRLREALAEVDRLEREAYSLRDADDNFKAAGKVVRAALETPVPIPGQSPGNPGNGKERCQGDDT